GVVGEEHLLALEQRAHPPQPLPDRRLQPGVDERDRPIGDVVGQQPHLAALQDEVVGAGLLVVQEVLLDVVPAVAEAEDEVLVPVVRVVAHHVPQQRPRPDRDHRLRRVGTPVPHAHPVAATEENDLHPMAPFRRTGTPGRPRSDALLGPPNGPVTRHRSGATTTTVDRARDRFVRSVRSRNSSSQSSPPAEFRPGVGNAPKGSTVASTGGAVASAASTHRAVRGCTSRAGSTVSVRAVGTWATSSSPIRAAVTWSLPMIPTTVSASAGSPRPSTITSADSSGTSAHHSSEAKNSRMRPNWATAG